MCPLNAGQVGTTHRISSALSNSLTFLPGFSVSFPRPPGSKPSSPRCPQYWMGDPQPRSQKQGHRMCSNLEIFRQRWIETSDLGGCLASFYQHLQLFCTSGVLPTGGHGKCPDLYKSQRKKEGKKERKKEGRKERKKERKKNIKEERSRKNEMATFVLS